MSKLVSILVTSGSDTFTTPMLERGIFGDILDIDESGFVNGFEDTITRHSESIEDDTEFLETEDLCVLDDLLGEDFCSIRSRLLRMLETYLSGSTAEDGITFWISEGDDSIIAGRVDVQYSQRKFDILFLCFGCFCSSCHENGLEKI